MHAANAMNDIYTHCSITSCLNGQNRTNAFVKSAAVSAVPANNVGRAHNAVSGEGIDG